MNIPFLLKSLVQGHYRKDMSGQHFVHQYQNGRNKRQADEPVTSPSGRSNFGQIAGEIARAAGMPPGIIMLKQGEQRGDHQGFGKEHIEQQHGDELRQAGYKTAEDFIADVLKTYTHIYQVSQNRYALVAAGQKAKIHIVELRHDKGQQVYSVVTGYIAERSYLEKFRLLWKKQYIRKSLAAALLLLRKTGGA